MTEIHPGPRNAITDVDGISVGQSEDRDLLTGVTVVLPYRPVLAAADVRGGGSGSRELAVLDPASTVQHVHAVALSGGSAFGLDAAGGVMHGLREMGRGFPVGQIRVPIVPAAILFDLGWSGEATWEQPPWWALGHAAVVNATKEVRLGNAGAGLGARAGRIKGGLGTASFQWEGWTIAALAIANPIGSVTLPGSRNFWAWPFEQGAEFGGLGPAPVMPSTLDCAFDRGIGEATTLVVVATDAKLDRGQAQRLATMAHDGLARAIRPVHAPLDGDTVIVLATGDVDRTVSIADLSMLGSLGADCTARAIARGVYEAEALAGCPCWKDLDEHGTFVEF